jgi:Putative stress-induced transcription regulator
VTPRIEIVIDRTCAVPVRYEGSRLKMVSPALPTYGEEPGRIGYDRAMAIPDPPDLIRSFAATSHADAHPDGLHTREDAAAWLHGAGLLPDGAALSNSEHAALVRLRDAIRDVLAAQASHREDGDAAARLTRALAEGRLVVTVSPAGTIRLATAARSSYPSVVAAIAVAIADCAATGTWPPLGAA